jgi:hypothetical protein
MRDIVGCGSTLHIACTAIFSVVKFFCTQKYNADEVIVLWLLIFFVVSSDLIFSPRMAGQNLRAGRHQPHTERMDQAQNRGPNDCGR